MAVNQDAVRRVRQCNCPACGHQVATPFFDGGMQPLATISWPATEALARSLPRHPLDFVRCLDCGHVFNAAFDYAAVPYSEKPNLMFNGAANWSRFLQDIRAAILARLPADPVVVEIGHGDGSLLAALAGERPAGRFIGFDPHGAARGRDNFEFRAELFDPAQHLGGLRPDLIVSRHVLEHLVNPLGFLQSVSFVASQLGLAPQAYLEVPCIDNVLHSARTVDFYYEHSSQFTTGSFTRMLSRASANPPEVGHGYGGEVVYGFTRLGASAATLAMAEESAAFRVASEAALEVIRGQLAELHAAGKSVAVWGGTGKSAAFMCRYGVDAERFPIVVDSDRDKAGTHAPGTGQLIRFRDWLLEHPVTDLIIPPQWRAADIIAEMARTGIEVERVFIEHGGRLIDYHREHHPYR